MSSESGSKTTTLVDTRYTVWSSETGEECPLQVPFSAKLPSTFNDGEAERMLPPSYNFEGFLGVPGMFVKSSYAVHILITRTRSQRVDFFTKTKRIVIPFNYYPRTRPHRPIVPSRCFFLAVKGTPEEWHQTVAPMKTPSSAGLEPIYTHLFIPASRVYGLRDTIPLHVQLTGPEGSLRTFLQPGMRQRGKSKRPRTADSAKSTSGMSTFSLPSLSSKRMRRLSSVFKSVTGATNSGGSGDVLPALPIAPQHPAFLPQESDSTQQTVRVFLLRQVTIESRSGKSWRNEILGEAKLEPVPPLLSTNYRSPYGIAQRSEEDHLDWEGELKVGENFRVGGFQAANVIVKDFIALAVAPKNQKTSASNGLQLTVPVKLVTDPWSESVGQLSSET